MAYNDGANREDINSISFDMILRFLRVIIAKWWVIVALVLVFTIAGYGFSIAW